MRHAAPSRGASPNFHSVLRNHGPMRVQRRVLYFVLRGSQMECIACQKSDLDDRLHKCPICFKLICDECCVNAFGRFFCSKKCSDQFFFGDDDE